MIIGKTMPGAESTGDHHMTNAWDRRLSVQCLLLPLLLLLLMKHLHVLHTLLRVYNLMHVHTLLHLHTVHNRSYSISPSADSCKAHRDKRCYNGSYCNVCLLWTVSTWCVSGANDHVLHDVLGRYQLYNPKHNPWYSKFYFNATCIVQHCSFLSTVDSR